VEAAGFRRVTHSVPTRRSSDLKDRRIKRIFLTSRANRVYASIWPIAESTVDDALGDLSASERKQLLDMMLRVKTKLQGLAGHDRSEEHTSELQSRENLVCRLLL